jgi:hypothetical protein
MTTSSLASSDPRSSSAIERFREIDEIVLGSRKVYFETVLKIREDGKDGGKPQIVPFRMNREQIFVDAILDKQRERIGRVRAIILKGRKQGISTYVGGRYFKRLASERDLRGFILAHEKPATKNLYDIYKRYYHQAPPEYRPKGRSTLSGLRFPLLGCDLQLATAGAGETGRSNTVHLFHGSEVAFWPQAERVAAAAISTVPEAPGTEIILESTANGIGNWFHEQWKEAEKGQGEFIAIFVPWFWHEEYERQPPANFVPSDRERQIKDLYKLTDAQIYWRRLRIIALGSEWRFKQEYPSLAIEAFQTKGVNGLISPEEVVKAREARLPEPEDWVAKIMGVDCARSTEGEKGDATRLLDRQGRVAGRLVNQSFRTRDTMKIVAAVANAIREHGIDMTFIDAGSMGGPIYDRLVQLGYGEKVRAVDFGGSAIREDRFKNKRAEMWSTMKDWLTAELPVQIPDEDALHGDLCAPCYEHDANGRLILEPKKKIKKRLKFSPDGGDALALTFAAPVVKPDELRPLARRLRGAQPKRSFMAS